MVTGKLQIKLAFLLLVGNLVTSCLVTNCPRGGKRGNLEIVGFESKLQRCFLCNSNDKICLEDTCLEGICEEEGFCVAKNICCSKRFCRIQNSCQPNLIYSKSLKPISLLTRILNRERNEEKDVTKSSEY